MTTNTETCGSCKHVKESPYGLWCGNDAKLHEDWGQEKEDPSYNDDHLIYSYAEGGSFQVGKNFGCIHWAGGK